MTDTAPTPLNLFNSLTRSVEPFTPVHPGEAPDFIAEARVYTCGPTVYNYQHIGNMRAYVFADTLGRTLSWKGYKLTHVINITDVGHLVSDGDEGEDKMESMAAKVGKSAWDIADHYTADFKRDLARLNIRAPAHPRATEYVDAMIEWGKQIAPKHCYELDGGLYFDVSTVPDYGRLARAVTDDGEGRIASVEGKRNAADFAIWRKTPAGETRQMEWDSPWGMGAPGWHLECSVMGEKLLGFPFDIHTGGIDHREIHHPNEIAQNQAFCGSADSGARTWMHNNFLVERSGKMSKSSGEFLRLQLLADKGYHPFAYRMMCLQAHYRSELEFSWDGLGAALTRLKRLILRVNHWQLKTFMDAHAGGDKEATKLESLTPEAMVFVRKFDEAISNDLNTSLAITVLQDVLAKKDWEAATVICIIRHFDEVLGLDLLGVDMDDLRLAPTNSQITVAEINELFARRVEARTTKDFAASDAIRDELAAKGVEVMDGDPLGWDWKL